MDGDEICQEFYTTFMYWLKNDYAFGKVSKKYVKKMLQKLREYDILTDEEE